MNRRYINNSLISAILMLIMIILFLNRNYIYLINLSSQGFIFTLIVFLSLGLYLVEPRRSINSFFLGICVFWIIPFLLLKELFNKNPMYWIHDNILWIINEKDFFRSITFVTSESVLLYLFLFIGFVLVIYVWGWKSAVYFILSYFFIYCLVAVPFFITLPQVGYYFLKEGGHTTTLFFCNITTILCILAAVVATIFFKRKIKDQTGVFCFLIFLFLFFYIVILAFPIHFILITEGLSLAIKVLVTYYRLYIKYFLLLSGIFWFFITWLLSYLYLKKYQKRLFARFLQE